MMDRMKGLQSEMIYELENPDDSLASMEEISDEEWNDYVQKIENNQITLSHSSTSKFLDSPRHFMLYKMKKKDPSPAMISGDLWHCLTLNPETLYDRFIIKPSTPGGYAKDICEALADYYLDERADADEGIITADEDALSFYLDKHFADDYELEARNHYTNAPTMNQLKARYTDKVLDYFKYLVQKEEDVIDERGKKGKRRPITEAMLDNARMRRDQTYFNPASKFVMDQIEAVETNYKWEMFGHKWTGFIDGQGKNITVDLKQVPNANPYKVRWLMDERGWHRQGAIYHAGAGFKNHTHYIIAMDKAGHVSVHRMSSSRKTAGFKAVKECITHFDRCTISNDWRRSFDFWSSDRNGCYEFM